MCQIIASVACMEALSDAYSRPRDELVGGDTAMHVSAPAIRLLFQVAVPGTNVIPQSSFPVPGLGPFPGRLEPNLKATHMHGYRPEVEDMCCTCIAVRRR